MKTPIPPGNYTNLATDGKRLYLLSYDASTQPTSTLKTFPITNKKPELETFLTDVRSYELSLDGKKVMVRTAKDLYVVDAGAKAPTEIGKSAVPLKDWSFSFDPRDEWRQMFVESWRLERDYFYDRDMHGLDWPAIRAKYAPLAERDHRSQRAGRCRGADGLRAVGASHLRQSWRRQTWRGRSASGVTRRAVRTRRGEWRREGGSHLPQPTRTCPTPSHRWRVPTWT